jgi:putative ABC transport system permease protein
MRLSVRVATGVTAVLAHSVGDAVARVDPAIGLTFMPLARQIDDSLVRERTLAVLSSFFGALALLLAGLGLYGLMTYSVGRRRREIGIRMALGADTRTVVRMVLARVPGARPRGADGRRGRLALGIAPCRSAPLPGSPNDPTTLLAAMTVIVLVATAAGCVPARRAGRIDPARVLHAD